MANQPETSTYEAGIYQLETSDPVQGGLGGVSNSPLLQLANRTKWLKGQVDSINTALAAIATLASPIFTGDPRAPTPATGDNDTSLATTAFVQNSLATTSKDVTGSGNVTLTSVEAGVAILDLFGTLSGARNVILPTSPQRAWIVRNRTSGAYALTVKTAGGTGVVVAQGYTATVFSDGTNIVRANTDLPDANLTGTPTATTAAPGDSSTRVATTAFVAGEAGFTNQTFSGSGNVAAARRTLVLVDASGGNITLTLPAANAAGGPMDIRFVRTDGTANTVTVNRAGADTIDGDTAIPLYPADRLDLVADGNTKWYQAGRPAFGRLAAQVTFKYVTGVLTVLKSFNISGVTRTAFGTYTCTFINAMPTANYTIAGAARLGFVYLNSAPTASAFTLLFANNFTNSFVDPDYASFSVLV